MKRYELIVIGAGPAGLSAAIEGAKAGMNVIVFDENARPGGQLFKQIQSFTPPCNMIVQDDSMAAAWDAKLYSNRMYSEEMSIVTGFYQYADSLWSQISPVCHEEAWCRRRIDALLAM